MRYVIKGVSESQVLLEGINPIVLGSGHGPSTKLFPECFGELVAIATFIQERTFCGSGFPGEESHHIIGKSFPRPVLQSFWLGRLKPGWEQEPEVGEMWLLFQRNVWREVLEPCKGDMALSQLLCQMFPCDFESRKTLVLGTKDALSELEYCLQETVFSEPGNCLLEAMVELGVPKDEIGEQTPLLQSKLQEIEAKVSKRLQKITAELEVAQTELDCAKQAYEHTTDILYREQGRLTALHLRREEWLQRYSEGVSS